MEVVEELRRVTLTAGNMPACFVPAHELKTMAAFAVAAGKAKTWGTASGLVLVERAGLGVKLSATNATVLLQIKCEVDATTLPTVTAPVWPEGLPPAIPDRITLAGKDVKAAMTTSGLGTSKKAGKTMIGLAPGASTTALVHGNHYNSIGHDAEPRFPKCGAIADAAETVKGTTYTVNAGSLIALLQALSAMTDHHDLVAITVPVNVETPWKIMPWISSPVAHALGVVATTPQIAPKEEVP